MSKKGQTRIRRSIGPYVWVQVLDRGPVYVRKRAYVQSEKDIAGIAAVRGRQSERKIVQDRNNTEKHNFTRDKIMEVSAVPQIGKDGNK